MDVTFNNALEGQVRQYFMGLPKQVQPDGSGQPLWPTGAPPEEGTPAQSGAPAPSSRPPSAAAAPPVPSTTPVAAPPRPPSEPLEPEPHIIHKATVMREAAEKRREMPETEDEEEPSGNLSPPSHIIRKPPRSMPSPAAAPAAPSPSPSRPPSAAPLPALLAPEPPPEQSAIQYRPLVHRASTPTSRPPDPYAPSRPPDPYLASRPPESYSRFHYDGASDGGRNSHGPAPSPQPSSAPPTYARLSSTMPQHAASRLRDSAAHSPPTQRYVMPVAHPPPPHNDRVPPIHHPQTPPAPRISSVDGRPAPMYQQLQPRRESASYVRVPAHYDRHSAVATRKYDPQQAYPGYRPSPMATQAATCHRIDSHQVPFKTAAIDVHSAHYPARPGDRTAVPQPPNPQDGVRLPLRTDYISRSSDARSGYPYATPSASSSKYAAIPGVATPLVQSAGRPTYRPAPAAKCNFDYPSSRSVQTSPARPITKTSHPNPQTRMTVSVTSLMNEINQANQTKQKRESPLDLSVKTVKNSADSSTTQDDTVDSMSIESKPLPLPPRPSPSSRHHAPPVGYSGSHKVDFAPNFTGSRHGYIPPQPQVNTPIRYNGSYNDTRRPEPYIVEPSYQSGYPERSKYTHSVGRIEHVPKIDLTRPVIDQNHPENRIRDDRQLIINSDRKRAAGPIVNNIPKKLVRYETWTADSRMSESMREQYELISRPVYNYSSHKQLEAYQNEKRAASSNSYREHHTHHNHRYPVNTYPVEIPPREQNDYHPHYHSHERTHIVNNRHHVIHKIPNHHVEVHPGIPADKKILSILRNSLETKQTGSMEASNSTKPDIIVIDDDVIEITDLTRENEMESNAKSQPYIQNTPNLDLHIQMPKAVDSLPVDYQRFDNHEVKTSTPENDVASRIRTKAELKVMPATQDNTEKSDLNPNSPSKADKVKLLPKSQKQHLFNQIRQDNLRFESVIKTEKPVESIISEVKSEPMNIEEIERDAEISIKTENILDDLDAGHVLHVNEEKSAEVEEDMDWASACDNFMEELKHGCPKKKIQRKRIDTVEFEHESNIEKSNKTDIDEIQPLKAKKITLSSEESILAVKIKQEPIDEDEILNNSETVLANLPETISENKTEDNIKSDKTSDTVVTVENTKNKKKMEKEKPSKNKGKNKLKPDKHESSSTLVAVKEEPKENVTKTVIKQEAESTDDDEPLIKSKLLKDKEKSDRLKYQLLKDLSEKSAYVKLECCDVDVNKNNRKSLDSLPKEKEDKPSKIKISRQLSRSKGKSTSVSDKNDQQNIIESSSDSEYDLSVASRLRTRKNTKTEDSNKSTPVAKTPVKSSSSKKIDTSSASNSSTPVRKPGFGDGSDFHPGWEEELYRYKRSIRMPSRLIAIPRGRSGGQYRKGASALFSRGSTSLPDLDPAPLSPAPSSAPSAATDDFYSRRQDKHTLDSDLDSNSSYSATNRLQYDSEASTSTVFSTSLAKKKGSTIVDVLIQKCGKKEDSRKKKDREDKSIKIIPKCSKSGELLPTPSLGLVKTCSKGSLSAKKEKFMEDIFYLGNFRKETVTANRKTFIEETGGLMGATEEFSTVVLKTRTRTESRVLKQRATIKEVFGDDRPASAPPISCREEDSPDEKEEKVEVKKELEIKRKLKPKKIIKDKLKRRSSSIRDGLRSTMVKRNDAKGRLLRLKKRNNMMKTLSSKKIKDMAGNKHKNENNSTNEEKIKPKGESTSPDSTEGIPKRRLKRLFRKGKKFSSGFDYIRKKKKIIRREELAPKIRRHAPKPSPESVHDIHKEIKSWFINKSIGETHLHRAARLGYTDCVAYCLEKLEHDSSAKDNAGFTPLHVAAAKGHVRIARLLLQYGANVSAAAQGGIRPLHEASENCHVEVIRLLLSYGADPLLGTYSGQMPEELSEGLSARLLQLHIADVQGFGFEPWRFPPPAEIIDREEQGCDPLSSPPPATPPPPTDSTMEIQCTEAPLPPFYSLRTAPGQPSDGLWCLLQDVTNLLQIKSKDSLLKQIHCGSGSPKELLREIRTQEFLERAQCHQLLCAGEKVNVRASKVALVRVTDKLRQLLKIETVLVS